MRAMLFVLGAALCSSAAFAQQTSDADRALLSRAAAERVVVERAAVEPSSDEAAARAEVVLAEAKLELVLARKALKADKQAEAARRAIRVQNSLRALPERIDASDLELQAEGLIARAEKHGVDVLALRTQLGTGGDAPAATLPADRDPLDARSRAAAEIARGYSGADTPDIDTTATAETLASRATHRQTPGEQGYQPAREAFDRDAIAARDQQRVAYQDGLRDAALSDELRRLVEADEARIAPTREISYPDNWKDIAQKRARYYGGEVARSQSWKDKDGREMYVALYDIRELTYVPPDFQPPSSLDLTEDLRNTLDRDALRQRSQIFSGTADDLAAGIPLLRFFGGVDDFAFRGPMYSREKAAQIAEQVRAFTTKMDESKIIVVP